MWTASVFQAGLAMAASGETSAGLPAMSVNPAGLFIQALAATTNTPERIPPTATMHPAARCSRGETFSQP